MSSEIGSVGDFESVDYLCNGNLQVGLMTLRSHDTQLRIVEWATRNERRVINQLLGTPSLAALDSRQIIANNPFLLKQLLSLTQKMCKCKIKILVYLM